MDTLLISGDHAVNGSGLPIAIGGARELIQRSLLRLSVPKGSFARAPELGSELRSLSRCPAGARDRVAMSYVQEALLPIKEIKVESVICKTPAPDVLSVEVGLAIEGKQYTLEVKA